MNKQDRIRIKNAVINALKNFSGPLTLPLPIKAIAKSWPNVRVVPYSAQMRRRNFSYLQMLSFAETDDACTDYDGIRDFYIIYYNDISPNKISSNRYRWNIAHELGHIALNHHKDYKETHICRNSVSSSLYAKLEDEADMFAAYILVPHMVVVFFGIQNYVQMAEFCKISSKAAKIRTSELIIWEKRGHSEAYDYDLLNLYAPFIEANVTHKRMIGWLNKHRVCLFCTTRLPLSYSFCDICGEKVRATYKKEVLSMEYPGIKIDDSGRALECPVCHNTELYADGTFCMICGAEIVNLCSGAATDSFRLCDHRDPLPGTARYCPYCGSKTTFFGRKFLSAWNTASEKSSDEEYEPLPF